MNVLLPDEEPSTTNTLSPITAFGNGANTSTPN